MNQTRRQQTIASSTTTIFLGLMAVVMKRLDHNTTTATTDGCRPVPITATRPCWLLVILICLLSKNEAFAFVIDQRSVADDHKMYLSASSFSSPDIATSLPGIQVDTRPHAQRADGPRLARRLNHAFRYLHRHNATDTITPNMTSREYLCQFYSDEKVTDMSRSFPPLLELDPVRHLYPKMRFLQETLKIHDVSAMDIPPQYFGARLEKILAPRHAFLVHNGLPNGPALFDSGSDDGNKHISHNKWADFLLACRKTKRFCALCNQWKRPEDPTISPKEIDAFDTLFGRGLLAAARNDLCQANNTWTLDNINITSAELIHLLVQHGANPLELDNRGVSTLHWAAGAGNAEAVKALLRYFPNGVLRKAKRDGATPLHWAAAGANSREFGTGGHPEVCNFLLSTCNSPDYAMNITTKELVNQLTFDGNSPLMWASWSGTLDTVKMMIRNRADHNITNRNGCTVAHWASSGGNLEVCKYLHNVVGVNFFEPNHGGNTPLTHAVAFGRVEIVEWLRSLQLNQDDSTAASLAQDFVDWTDNDSKRAQVLQLFQDDYWEADDDQELSTTVEDQLIEFS